MNTMAITNKWRDQPLKLFLMLFMPFLLLCTFTVISIVVVDYALYRENLSNTESRVIDLLADNITDDLNDLEADILFLAQQQTVSDYIDNEPEAEAGVIELFSQFLLNNPSYFQVRLIDQDGQEQVVVENAQQSLPRALQADELENKSDRVYYLNTRELGVGNIYVSPLDLNVENGIIEEPLQPTLRVITPLLSDNGSRWGILVINFDASSMLSTFKAISRSTLGNISLLNADGYWLASENREDEEWGFMLPGRTQMSMPIQSPEAWEQLRSASVNQVQIGSTYYSLAYLCFSIDCLGFTPASNLVHPMPFTASDFPWLILSSLSIDGAGYMDALLSDINRTLPVIVMFLGIILFAGFVSWRFAALINNLNEQEKKLRQSSELIKAFFENNPDMLYVKDIVGRYLYANKSTKESLGLDVGQEIDGNDDAYMPEGAAQQLRIQREQVIKEKKAIESYDSLETRTGELKQFRSMKFPLLNEDGDVYAIGTIAIDVTQQNKIAKALERSELRLKTILDSAGDAILLIDDKGVITMANKQAETLFGYPMDQLLTMNVDCLVPESSRISHQKNRKLYFKTPEVRRFGVNKTFNALASDGSNIPVEIALSPVKLEENSLMVVCVIHDISERTKFLEDLKDQSKELKRLNQELEEERSGLEDRVISRTRELFEAKLAAEASNKAKSNFLASMSHEIRTPLNGIIGTIGVLSESQLGAKQKQLAEDIKESSESLLSIISSILDFSKIDAGKETLNIGEIEFERLLGSFEMEMELKAREAGTELYVYKEPSVPPVIISDSVRLRQIMVNLLDNALKFSSGLERAGKVSLRLAIEDNANLLIQVSDNGIGIPEEDQTNIFEPFTKAEASSAMRYGPYTGVGLGLTICKKIAELMGGDFTVESKLDEGSTFTFRIPVKIDKQDEPDLTGKDSLDDMRVYLFVENKQKEADLTDWLQYFGATVVPTNTLEKASFSNLEDGVNNVLIVQTTKLDESNFQEILNDQTLESLQKLIFIGAELTFNGNSSNEKIFRVLEKMQFSQTFSQIVEILTEDANSVIQGHKAEKLSGEAEDSLLKNENISILVVEDNLVNQRVISNQLDFLNYEYDIASNGSEALGMLSAKDYHLVLTDLDMPVMDGYELVNSIRGKENELKNIPIIAYTANATKGERKKCLLLGMNDYLTKPVSLELLQKVLEKWTDTAETGSLTVPEKLHEQDDQQKAEVFDVTFLVELLGGADDVIGEFLTAYTDSAKSSKKHIMSAVENKEWSVLKREAHTLKSSSRSIGANEFGSVCEALEKAAERKDDEQVESLLPEFKTLLDKLMASIDKWVDKNE